MKVTSIQRHLRSANVFLISAIRVLAKKVAIQSLSCDLEVFLADELPHPSAEI
jgi:hypothetical protein